MTEPKVPGGTWAAPEGRLERNMGADAEAVRRLAGWLVARFDEYVSEHDTASVDVLMAVHNFHKVIVFDLIKQTEMGEEEARFFRQMAASTFDEAMRKGR